jgi:DNA-binding response OmpR family regulator
VLVVTDQPVLADLIAATLDHGRFVVRPAATVAAAAAHLARHADPHLVFLDLDVEGRGGEQVMARLGLPADRSARVPVIALTRRGDLKTALAAFDRGVDDLLTVPFAPAELLARTLAVVRRTYGVAVPLLPALTRGALELDLLHKTARAGGRDLHLTPLEQSLLYLLAANVGRVLTRDEILDHLWGTDYLADSNVIDRHVRNLRAKLGDDWRHPRYLATVPGQGYRFLPPAADADQAVGPAAPAWGPASRASDGRQAGSHGPGRRAAGPNMESPTPHRPAIGVLPRPGCRMRNLHDGCGRRR